MSPLGNMVSSSWCCVRSGMWCIQVGVEPAREHGVFELMLRPLGNLAASAW